MRRVRNWARSAGADPARIARPRSEGEVAALVRAARADGLPVKAIGAGHSFTPIAMTEGVLVDLSALSGLVAHDVARRRVVLGAGTRLRDLPAILAPLGLALENMGDIDAQTIAGATSTGTHGTGIGFGGLATQITGARIVDGTGRIIRVAHDENAELLPAVRLGLGALGVLTQIEIQCVPSFVLHAVERSEPFAAIDDLLDRAREIDHVEAYWWPHTDRLSTKQNVRLPSDAAIARPHPAAEWVEDELLGNAALAAKCAVGWAIPPATPALNRAAAALYGSREFADDSHRVFTSPRRVRFRELEYAIPAAALPDALRQVRRAIERSGERISFPVELRFAAADDVWLSTAYGRETAYVAVHRWWREDPRALFAAVEDVLRRFDGRPHWGKLHTRRRVDLEPAYSRMGDFLAVRERMDPERVFRNAYTRRVLGE